MGEQRQAGGPSPGSNSPSLNLTSAGNDPQGPRPGTPPAPRPDPGVQTPSPRPAGPGNGDGQTQTPPEQKSPEQKEGAINKDLSPKKKTGFLFQLKEDWKNKKYTSK